MVIACSSAFAGRAAVSCAKLKRQGEGHLCRSSTVLTVADAAPSTDSNTEPGHSCEDASSYLVSSERVCLPCLQRQPRARQSLRRPRCASVRTAASSMRTSRSRPVDRSAIASRAHRRRRNGPVPLAIRDAQTHLRRDLQAVSARGVGSQCGAPRLHPARRPDDPRRYHGAASAGASLEPVRRRADVIARVACGHERAAAAGSS